MTKYDELRKAVSELGEPVKGRADYRKRYKAGEFPDWFPSDPAQAAAYRDDFKAGGGWPGFLDKPQYAQKYKTLNAAAYAARRLGIRSKEEYKERYVEDKMLPASPDKHYATTSDYDVWKGWRWFLTGFDFYEHLRDAAYAAYLLGIKTSRQYEQEYIHDPRLPSNPETFYKKWRGWKHFLGANDGQGS